VGGQVEAEERSEIGAALGELAAAFSGLVEVLMDGGQARLHPERIVHVAARVIPGCRHAAVAVVEQDKPRTLASTRPGRMHSTTSRPRSGLSLPLTARWP
jgi:hypothetical protein